MDRKATAKSKYILLVKDTSGLQNVILMAVMRTCVIQTSQRGQGNQIRIEEGFLSSDGNSFHVVDRG